jgi:hypothetical protein
MTMEIVAEFLGIDTEKGVRIGVKFLTGVSHFNLECASSKIKIISGISI